MPEIVLVELAAELGRTEPDPEIQELVTASAGVNCGIDFLPGALDYNPARPGTMGSLRASEIVWLDALTTNVDRTARNPNLLVWHRETWLIDHGASLYQHHSDRDLVGRAHEPFPLIAEHVLLPLAGDLRAVDGRLASVLSRDAVAAAVGLVPEEWLGPDTPSARAAYVEYFCARLAAPRAFVDEAEAARGA